MEASETELSPVSTEIERNVTPYIHASAVCFIQQECHPERSRGFFAKRRCQTELKNLRYPACTMQSAAEIPPRSDTGLPRSHLLKLVLAGKSLHTLKRGNDIGAPLDRSLQLQVELQLGLRIGSMIDSTSAYRAAAKSALNTAIEP